MTDDPVLLARDLAAVAAEMDSRGLPYGPGIRRAAFALLHLAMLHQQHGSTGCPGCGAEVDQPERGRRRTWCSERCRRRFRT